MAGSETRRGGGSEEGVGQVHVRMCLVHHAEFLSLKDWRPRKESANHPVGSRKDGSVKLIQNINTEIPCIPIY